MNKIGIKLFLSFLCMAALTVGLLWVIQAGLMKDSYLKSRVNSVAQAVYQAALSDSADRESLQEEYNISIIAFNQDGSLQSSPQGIPMMGMMVKACQAMIPGQIDGSAQLVSPMGSMVRYALLGYPAKGGGYLFAIISLADADEASRILRTQLWLITVILLLAASLLAIVLARLFSRPIRAVTGAARELAAGRLNVELPVKSKDEIGELTVALNDLSVQLQKTDNLRKELIANVSHELKAPLAVIQGYAETVRDVTWPNEEKRTQQLNMVSEEASRLSRVVADIMNYSKLQAGVESVSVAEFPVCPVLDGILEKFALIAAAKKITIAMDCAEQQILFDRDKFEQVINNLLHNAINHADAESAIKVAVRPLDGISRISIANIGENIPPDELTRIWDRYYRAQNVREDLRLGTGLGLAIVKSILEKHQVAFGVSSENRETVFWFDTCPPRK